MIFEINPRFSSTAFMRHKLGFMDVIWSIEEFYGNSIKLISIEEEIELARKQDIVIF